ncbi:MAG: hypothetical protein Kow0069_22490 [Promethearchaeota archaeon]
MALRLLGKAIKLALRSRKRYVIFTLSYMFLMIGTSVSIQLAFLGESLYYLGISLASSIFISVLYAWIIINYRRTEIATLKCLGWTNSNVRVLIVGEIVWTAVSGFLLVLEIVFHALAFRVLRYNVTFVPNLPEGTSAQAALRAPISLLTIVATLGIFLGVQVLGILVAYRKILKVRPIIALRVMA